MYGVMPIGSGFGAFLGACSTTLTMGGLGTYAVAIWSNIILLLAAMTLVFFKGETRPPELSAAADLRRMIPALSAAADKPTGYRMRFFNHLLTRVLLFPGGVCLLALATLACDIQGEAGAIVESPSSRLETVKDRGNIHCATQSDLPGFGFIDSAGNERGFDVDLCRGRRGRHLCDPGAVEFQHVSYAERGPLLQAAEIDILARTTTWTTTREIQWGDFTIIMFYDGRASWYPGPWESAAPWNWTDRRSAWLKAPPPS